MRRKGKEKTHADLFHRMARFYPYHLYTTLYTTSIYITSQQPFHRHPTLAPLAATRIEPPKSKHVPPHICAPI